MIIKNELELIGNVDDVEEVVRHLQTENGGLDFNEIIPLSKDKSDIPMNEYVNAILNVYMLSNSEKIDRERFISTMKFVGYTREYPFCFRELSEEEINIFKTKYPMGKMLKDADYFIKQVATKSIFNGYIVREGNWGCGTQPFNVKISGNRIKFNTCGNPAERIVAEISRRFPKVKIIYTYVYENKNENSRNKEIINKVAFKDETRTEIVNQEFEGFDTFKLITSNVTI